MPHLVSPRAPQMDTGCEHPSASDRPEVNDYAVDIGRAPRKRSKSKGAVGIVDYPDIEVIGRRPGLAPPVAADFIASPGYVQPVIEVLVRVMPFVAAQFGSRTASANSSLASAATPAKAAGVLSRVGIQPAEVLVEHRDLALDLRIGDVLRWRVVYNVEHHWDPNQSGPQTGTAVIA